MIKEGDEIPYHKFRVRHQYNMELAITFNDTLGEWGWINTNQVFAKKRIVLVGIPGAFTPTCGRIHIPRYEQNYRKIKSLGIDEIYCTAVNDPFVMDEFLKHNAIGSVKLLPDGNSDFAEKLGMLCDMSYWNYGKRSWRYSMVVDNGVVEKLFVEPGFPNDPTDPYKESAAETMLLYLREKGIGDGIVGPERDQWTQASKYYYGDALEKHQLEDQLKQEKVEITRYREDAQRVLEEELGKERVKELLKNNKIEDHLIEPLNLTEKEEDKNE